MTDPSEPAENPQSADQDRDTPGSDDDSRTAWSSEELARLAQRLLRRGSLHETAESVFKDHPDVASDAVEYVDDDEFKP